MKSRGGVFQNLGLPAKTAGGFWSCMDKPDVPRRTDIHFQARICKHRLQRRLEIYLLPVDYRRLLLR